METASWFTARVRVGGRDHLVAFEEHTHHGRASAAHRDNNLAPRRNLWVIPGGRAGHMRGVGGAAPA